MANGKDTLVLIVEGVWKHQESKWIMMDENRRFDSVVIAKPLECNMSDIGKSHLPFEAICYENDIIFTSSIHLINDCIW